MDVQKIPKRPPFYIFRHYATYRKLQKNSEKKFGIFFSIFSFLRAFVVSSCRKNGFRVFLSLRYGAVPGLLHVTSSSFLSLNCAQSAQYYEGYKFRVIRRERPKSAPRSRFKKAKFFEYSKENNGFINFYRAKKYPKRDTEKTRKPLFANWKHQRTDCL